MRTRIQLKETIPEGIRAAAELERYVRGKVDPQLLHLVKLRASIVNGCAYCIDLHSREALASGETAARLFAVAAWRESPFFSVKERVALELTDAVTRIDAGGVPDELWAAAAAQWSDAELANLIVAVATINVWNRLAIAFQQVRERVIKEHQDDAEHAA